MNTNTPGYMPAVLDLAAVHAKPGTVSELFVLHDDGCALLADRGPCTCSPTVTAGVVLWRRATRRAKWEAVDTFATEALAYGAMTGSADFLILPTGQQP